MLRSITYVNKTLVSDLRIVREGLFKDTGECTWVCGNNAKDNADMCKKCYVYGWEYWQNSNKSSQGKVYHIKKVSNSDELLAKVYDKIAYSPARKLTAALLKTLEKTAEGE